ncbi:MAG: DUF4350 domain-containing protein [Candidatus Heimdallarchaeaceae archaeon]
MSSKLFSLSFYSSPLFKIVIQTLIVFALILLPLSINITRTFPPYSIENTDSGGLFYFNSVVKERGFNTTRTLLSTNPILDLPDSSILVIAGGSKNYRDSEKKLIDSFVLKGGTLLLLVSKGPSDKLASYFGIFLSSSYILETEHYYKSPEIILTNAPAGFNTTLCFSRARAIVEILQSEQQKEIQSFYSQSTAFLDENNDKMWSEFHEPTRRQKIGTVVSRGKGVIIVISSASFLTNDLFLKGFGNINVTISLLGSYSSGETKLICFEESHKRWPFSSTEGVINQSYGTIILLSKDQVFIFSIVFLILLLFYMTPRLKDVIKTKESYKQFISDRIWSRKRELFDTFGVPIKPTVEEEYLSRLYFQYELYPTKAYTYYLLEKLRRIPLDRFTEDERTLFEKAIVKKIDGKTFLSLFKKIEEIQKRGKLI